MSGVGGKAEVNQEKADIYSMSANRDRNCVGYYAAKRRSRTSSSKRLNSGFGAKHIVLNVSTMGSHSRQGVAPIGRGPLFYGVNTARGSEAAPALRRANNGTFEIPWFPRLPMALYGLAMADERDTQFASDLTRMTGEEVRQQIEPVVQPVPFLRAMAVTELERRRQKRTDALKRPNMSVGRLVVGAVVIAAVIAALTVWLRWPDGIG